MLPVMLGRISLYSADSKSVAWDTEIGYKSPKSPFLDYAGKLWGLLLHRKNVNGFFLSPTVCIGKMEGTVR
jgi:hypothetical protein